MFDKVIMFSQWKGSQSKKLDCCSQKLVLIYPEGKREPINVRLQLTPNHHHLLVHINNVNTVNNTSIN